MTLLPNDLRSFPIFADYSDEELEDSVLPVLTELIFEEDSVICRERAPGDSCFFLMSGEVSVQKAISSGKTEQIGLLQAGSLFGQMVLLDGGTRSASCVAVRRCRVFELTRDDFDALRARGSKFAFDMQLLIGKSLCKQIRQATNNLSAMSESRVEDPQALSQRLESFLKNPSQPQLERNEYVAADSVPRIRIKDFEL
ncbi:MAG: hypothetical protein AUK47_13730 [Deltaproteobacteria bacterium CG2_30_63_29]|nr:MAG: hypothetical protein AUK47_13730 [Deltaproteobacteria bacterium CG2_30_63_29]PJB36525.1 MAG: hypothetical protein CO108_23100 [Deltaproteobacteria bacterium CG_4_9_14_3_um_filter_63_12]